MDMVDSIVIGAGAVGLAVARALAVSGREVIVLEAEANFGTGVSSRNSEVIHAGIYYPTGSLKARLCIKGRALLYAYCAEKQINVCRLGKHIVAADEAQCGALKDLWSQARVNGVDDIVWLDAQALHRAEPEVVGIAGIFSPSTGIFDAHAYMNALLGDFEAAGGAVAYLSSFKAARTCAEGHVVEIGGQEPYALACRELVNAAGLCGSDVAEGIVGAAPIETPETFFARGCYFELRSALRPFNTLIYPMPEPGGLGIHATMDLGGRVRFGPDVEWIDAPDYGVPPERAEAFYDRIRVYWPGLPDGALQPAYAGVRPKLKGPGQTSGDFVIRDRGDGVVDLLGIESPGLTSSLSIAEYVLNILDACLRR